MGSRVGNHTDCRTSRCKRGTESAAAVMQPQSRHSRRMPGSHAVHTRRSAPGRVGERRPPGRHRPANPLRILTIRPTLQPRSYPPTPAGPGHRASAESATYTFFLAPFLPPFVSRLFLPTAMVLLREPKGRK